MRYLRAGDLLLVILTAVLIAAVSVLVYSDTREQGSEVHIQVQGREYVYELDEDREIEVSGPIGTTGIVVSDGAVHVHDSPCRAKICISAGSISRPGQWIICLPNSVFITIEGETPDQEQVDDYVY